MPIRDVSEGFVESSVVEKRAAGMIFRSPCRVATLNRLTGSLYEALQGYAGPFDCCEKILQEDNVYRFIRATAKTIPLVKKQMKDAEDHLLSMTCDHLMRSRNRVRRYQKTSFFVRGEGCK